MIMQWYQLHFQPIHIHPLTWHPWLYQHDSDYRSCSPSFPSLSHYPILPLSNCFFPYITTLIGVQLKHHVKFSHHEKLPTTAHQLTVKPPPEYTSQRIQ